MSDQTNAGSEWTEYVKQLNETYFNQLEQGLEAQNEFLDAWYRAVDETFDEGEMGTDIDGYLAPYEAWINASQSAFDRMSDAMDGEDVDISEFRDIWLDATNEAFKELMGTDSAAAMMGQFVEESLDLRRQLDEYAEESIHGMGFANRSDVQEVGERLVELERRQHAVEEKLDRVLEALEE